MKVAAFTTAFALFGAAFSQEIFRCRCADASDQNIAGIDSLCTSKGGEAETTQLCIKVPSRFTNEECEKVQAGATGDCIVDTISGNTSSVSSPVTTATVAPQAAKQ
ncbi:hypothetical protein EsH8_II_001234 [Colletotrichum jinshuiense]